MEYYFLLIILSVVTSASSKAFNFVPPDLTEEVPKSLSRVKRDIKDDSMKGHVLLPTFSIYLIGFSMLFMLIVIVILGVVLYLALEKKWIFGLNAPNKQYVRQESTGVVPLYSATYEEQNKNNGSTLTVNSGIIEISEPRASDPITPTRLEESKIIFAKRPLKAVMDKGQMDAICKEVLRKVQKSDSASFRDLNELLKFEKRNDNIGMKSEDVKESEKEDKNEENAEFKVESQLFKLKKPEIKTETQKEIQTKIQDEINTKIQEEHNSKIQDELKTKIQEEFNSKILGELNSKIQGELNSKMQGELKTKIQEELITQNVTQPKIKEEKINETKQETKNKTTNEPVSEPKPDEIKDARIDKLESDKNEDDSDSETEYDTVPSPIRFRHSGPAPDQSLYDTVPNPIKYRHSDPETDHLDQSLYDTVASPQSVRHSGAETDDDIDDIYDLPPSRGSLDGQPRNVIQMDPETQYLMPFSSQHTDSCYVNAKTKRQSFKSP